jgi:hypothetical protein
MREDGGMLSRFLNGEIMKLSIKTQCEIPLHVRKETTHNSETNGKNMAPFQMHFAMHLTGVKPRLCETDRIFCGNSSNLATELPSQWRHRKYLDPRLDIGHG